MVTKNSIAVPMFLISISSGSQVVADTSFVRLSDFTTEIVIDMKYATPDNFLNVPVYECGECYLRKATADALMRANIDFMKKGYRIKVFDCYRP